MIVVEHCDDTGNYLSFYEPGAEEPFRVVHFRCTVHSILRVCRRTREIYIYTQHDSTISVYSEHGDFLRRIVLRLRSSQWERSFTVTDDGHLLVCEKDGRLSVWTYEGEFICRWSMDGEPYCIAILPRGGVAVSFVCGRIKFF